MARSGAGGEWSIKATIPHTSWFEQEMAELLETKEPVGSGLWGLPPDDRNASLYAKNHEQSLNETLFDSTESFNRLVSDFETPEDIDLSDPKRYKNMPPGWVPWQIIAQNSYDHYRHHVADISAWTSQT